MAGENLSVELDELRAKKRVLEESLREYQEDLQRAEVQNEVLENVLFGLETEYRKAQDALNEAKQELLTTIDQLRDQQAAVRSLGVPIIDVWDDVLALPVIGAVDEERAMAMAEALLTRIATTQSQCVVVDLTGVDHVDTATADHLLRLVKAIRLQGAFCVISGIGPSIAQTMVNLHVAFEGVPTLRTLRDGLRVCMAHLEEQ